MSKITIKSHSVKEDNAAVSWTNAYRDLVSRCWHDTPDGKKPNYSEKAINFILDCAHIANGTNVKGLPQQGFTLKKAHISELVGDCLHLQYSKDDGRKGVDVWLNPHTQKVSVDLYGFDPERPYDVTHKVFFVHNSTADDFCDFIENLPNYKGESLMKQCSMSKKIESLRKKNEDASQYVDFAKKKVADEYADDYGVFTDVYELLNEKAYELADDIISENGLDASAREKVHEAVYDEFCKTIVTSFGGVERE